MTTAEEWAAKFADVPPVLASLLRDLLQERSVRLQRQREALVRRPVTAGFESAARDVRTPLVDRGMRAIDALVHPQFSEKPFAEALTDATDLPRGTVAFYAGLSRGQLFDVEHGNKPLTKSKLEAVAKAIGVDPSYFHEWRRIVLMEMVEETLTPERSVWIYAQASRAAVPGARTESRVRRA